MTTACWLQNTAISTLGRPPCQTLSQGKVANATNVCWCANTYLNSSLPTCCITFRHRHRGGRTDLMVGYKSRWAFETIFHGSFHGKWSYLHSTIYAIDMYPMPIENNNCHCFSPSLPPSSSLEVTSVRCRLVYVYSIIIRLMYCVCLVSSRV